VARSIHEFDEAEWDALGAQRTALTHRWQRAMEAGRRNYQPRYLLLEDARGPLALAVANLADTFGRSGWREWLLQRLTLMVRAPCSTDPGIALRPDAHVGDALAAITRGLGALGWRDRRLLLVFNDVPASELPIWRAQRFLAFDHQPPTTELDLTGLSYEGYLAALPYKYRKELRRQDRRAAELGLRFEIEPLTGDSADLFPLMAEIYAQHGTPAERMSFTPALFPALARELPGEMIVARGMVQGELAGFMVGLLERDAIWGSFVGLHYPLAHPTNLYFLLPHAIIRWAIEHGYRRIFGGMTNYREKQKQGFQLQRRWMCVRTSSGPLNAALPLAQRLIGRSSWQPEAALTTAAAQPATLLHEIAGQPAAVISETVERVS
jgi:hypothetical protein